MCEHKIPTVFVQLGDNQNAITSKLKFQYHNLRINEYFGNPSSERLSAIIHQDSSEVKQVVTAAHTNTEWNISPKEKESFCLTSSRGNLHVLLSSSVPLILPLILHCPHVKPKVHIQIDPGQQSRGYQSMKWKKRTTPFPHSPQSNPCETAQHLIKLIKWLDQLPVMVSGPEWLQCCAEGMYTYWSISTEYSNCSWQNKLYNYWWHGFTHWIKSRALCVMYWAGFNCQSKWSDLWKECCVIGLCRICLLCIHFSF